MKAKWWCVGLLLKPKMQAESESAEVQFEEYLLENLSGVDVCDDEEGNHLFNVNKAAYLVEGSNTENKQNATRKRLGKGIDAVNPTPKKCPRSGRDVPFAKTEDIYQLCLHHLKGSMANQMREGSSIVFVRGLKNQRDEEDEMAEHLLAWAQCGFIPMFSSRNTKVFEDCIFRPDVTWTLADIVVMLECDQHAHSSYNREEERQRTQYLMDAASKNNQLTVMIRFNPSLPGTTKAMKFATLLAVLINVFSKKKEYIGTSKSLIYLFYPGKEGSIAPSHVWYPQMQQQQQ